VAVGGYSYGHPRVPEYEEKDGLRYDDWLPWVPVFRMIDKLNRDDNGKALPQFRAMLYVHEGAKFSADDTYAPGNPLWYPDLTAKLGAVVGRYRKMYKRLILPERLIVPLGATELGFGADYPGFCRPPEEEVCRQFVAYSAEMAKDWYFVGGCAYDMRDASEEEFEDFIPLAPAIRRAFAEDPDPSKPRKYVYGSITIPQEFIYRTPQEPVPGTEPDTEPLPTTVAVETIHPIGQWIRKFPNLSSETLGALDKGFVGEVAQEEAHLIGQENTWIHIQTDWAEGHTAAWLLKRKG